MIELPRRSFLAGMLALGAAPAIATSRMVLPQFDQFGLRSTIRLRMYTSAAVLNEKWELRPGTVWLMHPDDPKIEVYRINRAGRYISDTGEDQFL